MNPYQFQELTDDEIKHRFAKTDRWRLEDIILLAFGYDYEGVEWKKTETNGFPQRTYDTALSATNQINGKARLNYIEKYQTTDLKTVCYVKKKHFFDWAHKYWGADIKRTYDLWRTYKVERGKISHSLDKPEAVLNDYGNHVQLEQFKAHCLAGKPPHKYRANLTAIGRQAKKEIPRFAKYASLRKYIKRLSLEDLMRLSGME